ncbi:MAG: hypothetical protein CR217_19515 [Beijerinckiaceae bacterium]|nr:MAG: hypothetical protein CR217_19515 [Beijerinckiaceae bacterium]
MEDWTIQNQADENHEFHMHQIHFLLLAPMTRRVTHGSTPTRRFSR